MLTYVGLDAVEKKFGQGKIDPQKERGVNEKITDKARGMFEKATGYDPPFHTSHPTINAQCTHKKKKRGGGGGAQRGGGGKRKKGPGEFPN